MIRERPPTADAETIAIRALGYIAADPERLGRFLSLTGIGPATLRQAASEPAFLAQVLDFIVQDDSTLLAFAANAGLAPASVAAARLRLGGGTDSGG